MGQTAVKSPHTYTFTFQPTGLLNYDKQLPLETSPQVAVLLTLQPQSADAIHDTIASHFTIKIIMNFSITNSYEWPKPNSASK